MVVEGLRRKLLRILAGCKRRQQLAESCARIAAQDAQEVASDLFRARRGALRPSAVTLTDRAEEPASPLRAD
jgi:hypothetical protein